MAFDFFNVSGGLYVDQQTTKDLRSSAQGLFMIMTNGIGATVGTLAAQAIVNHYVFSQTTPEAQHAGWTTSWYIFAAYSLVIAVLFIFLFKDTPTPPMMRRPVLSRKSRITRPLCKRDRYIHE